MRDLIHLRHHDPAAFAEAEASAARVADVRSKLPVIEAMYACDRHGNQEAGDEELRRVVFDQQNVPERFGDCG